MTYQATKVLLKIFARGFYKEHAGLLLFLFVVIFSHCFWMKPLGGHLTDEESIFYHLIMLISFANDPVMMSLVFITWIIYSIKSWQFVSRQMKAEENKFLFYCITSVDRIQQFGHWFYVQFVILLPAVLYGISAAIIGTIYNYYVIPIVIMLFLLFLMAVGAAIYVFLINRLELPQHAVRLFKMTQTWPKPFFSLSLYYILNTLKLVFGATKILSLLIMVAIHYFFSDISNEFRLFYLASLLIVLVHIFIIYQIYLFEENDLSFRRTLPIPRGYLFLNFIVSYLFILLPETIWTLGKFTIIDSLALIVNNLSLAILFYSLNYTITQNIAKFIKVVFALFIFYFLVIMYGYGNFIFILNIPLAYWIFRSNYYNSFDSTLKR